MAQSCRRRLCKAQGTEEVLACGRSEVHGQACKRQAVRGQEGDDEPVEGRVHMELEEVHGGHEEHELYVMVLILLFRRSYCVSLYLC